MTTRGDFAADRRLLYLSVIAIVIGAFCTFVAWVLLALIHLFTNIFYFQRLSIEDIGPGTASLGLWAIMIPVLGGLIIGLMARFGSERIRGHGIPEALEAILYGKSIMQPKVALLKPLSSAIAIGSGGPFGAEGPIIMTGGAIGSIIAQAFQLTAVERKTLLVAGASAGMSAVFATPMAAVLLAVELLLFEWKPRSLVPVALASIVASAIRPFVLGVGPLFPVPAHSPFTPNELIHVALLGVMAGAFSSLLSSALYKMEDGFSHLRMHWMWWPALGGLAVGIGGYFEPRALGVGYDVIGDFLKGNYEIWNAMKLLSVKALIWVIALASGTSGGVLAPLLMMGCGLGAIFPSIISTSHPTAWPMIGMAATLGGMMRCPFTAVLFAFELTQDLQSLLPLFTASILAYAFTVLVMKRSILTEKIARRGFDIFREYGVDPLQRVLVREVMTSQVVSIPASLPATEVAKRYFEGRKGKRGYPVVDENKKVIGVLTASDLIDTSTLESNSPLIAFDLLKTQVVTVNPNTTCRAAAEKMAEFVIGRLPVTDPMNGNQLVGIVTRSDLIKSNLWHLEEEHKKETFFKLPKD